MAKELGIGHPDQQVLQVLDINAVVWVFAMMNVLRGMNVVIRDWLKSLCTLQPNLWPSS